MPFEQFERLRQAVLQDQALQERLYQILDLDEFVSQVLSEAEELGLEVTAEDVRSVMRANQRAWLERWIR